VCVHSDVPLLLGTLSLFSFFLSFSH
jgi:hypothetical protein